MAKDRNKAVPASYLLLKRDGKILLMRRQNSGYYDGWYSVPAGHVEAGELPIDALVRETKEELGITLNKNDVRLVHTMYRTKHDETGDRADLFFEATKWTGEISNTESHKCDDIQRFPINELPAGAELASKPGCGKDGDSIGEKGRGMICEVMMCKVDRDPRLNSLSAGRPWCSARDYRKA